MVNLMTFVINCSHVSKMLKKQIYVTGTVRSNRRGLPKEIKATLKKKRCEIFAERSNVGCKLG